MSYGSIFTPVWQHLCVGTEQFVLPRTPPRRWLRAVGRGGRHRRGARWSSVCRALLSRRVGPASRLQQLLLDAGQGVIHCLHCVGSDWVCCINAPAPVDVGHRSFSSIINGNLVKVQRRYSGWFGGLSHRAFSLTPSLFKIKIISHARHRESSPCVIAAVAAQGHNHEFCGIACPPLKGGEGDSP